eukprot:TRINITY_DN21400_c0_g1_i1.p1 TRINITY_DN21400_c0_g1~~TRINITY_DN21400_c0_g1_i1.p1  ORF type:complete len:209 (-),score=17.52 TRINITY_DN21400_c0_g1_i1:190-816(-)
MVETSQEYILPDCSMDPAMKEQAENIIVKTEKCEEILLKFEQDMKDEDDYLFSKVKVEISEHDFNTEETQTQKWICEICNYATKKRHNFKRHTNKCKGVYTCNDCNFATSRESVFKMHKLTTKRCTKDFKCKNCSFETSLLSNLKRHEKCCPSEKPESCTLCNMRAKTKDALKRHTKRYHKDRWLSVQTAQGNSLIYDQNTFKPECPS